MMNPEKQSCNPTDQFHLPQYKVKDQQYSLLKHFRNPSINSQNTPWPEEIRNERGDSAAHLITSRDPIPQIAQ